MLASSVSKRPLVVSHISTEMDINRMHRYITLLLEKGFNVEQMSINSKT